MRRHGAVPLTAPRTPMNASITPDRSVAFARVSLDEVKAVKEALGVKVNDVILAICSGTLRHYLKGIDALPEEPLLAVCPVSVRTEDQRGLTRHWTPQHAQLLRAAASDPGGRPGRRR